MTSKVEKILEWIQKNHPQYNGWDITWEFPGYFSFYRETTEISVTYNENKKSILIQKSVDFENVDSQEEKYTGSLTPKKLFEVVRKYL